jgi:hypothetical protein
MRGGRKRSEYEQSNNKKGRSGGRAEKYYAAFPGWTVPQFAHVRRSTLE